MTGRPLRVFLVDDQEVVLSGVRALLEPQRDLVVVGEAATAAHALARVPALEPDVVVLELRLPDGDGGAVCRVLKEKLPNLSCLVLTSVEDDDAVLRAVMAGASGYVLKRITGADLVAAVRAVGRGESLLDARATSGLLQRLRDDATQGDPLGALTSQERRILELIGAGLSNREIGERLYLAEKTVKNHVSSLLNKLGMVRRTQAAVLFARLSAQRTG